MPHTLTKTFRFEAAHFLPCFPEGHKCRRLHGHSFIIEVHLTGRVDPEQGILIDFGDITRVVKPFIELLDHRLINDVGAELNAPLLQNPTSENLALWFYQSLKPLLPDLSAIVVHETCTSRCTYFE